MPPSQVVWTLFWESERPNFKSFLVFEPDRGFEAADYSLRGLYMGVPQSVCPAGAIPLCLKHLTVHRVSRIFVNLTFHFLGFS